MGNNPLCEGDLVIDTNVLAHCLNEDFPSHSSAREVVYWMHDCSAKWVLDNTGKNRPDPHTSVLYKEYCDTLPLDSVPLLVLELCLETQRVEFSDRVAQEVKKTIARLVPRNSNDQKVLGASVGSSDRVLVSNDYDDFPVSVRKTVLKKLGVSIVSSGEFFTS